MLDPNLLRNEPDAVAEKLARRGFKLDVDKLGALEERRKVLQVKTENLQAERNSRSKSIGQAKARGEDIEPLRLEVNKLGEELDAAKAELDALQAEIRDIALTIPNVGAGRDLTVGVLCRDPYFQVVSFASAKAHVASAKDDFTVRQAQQLQDFFCMTSHLFQRRH